MTTLAPLGMALADDKPMLDCQSWYRHAAAEVGKARNGALGRLECGLPIIHRGEETGQVPLVAGGDIAASG